MLKASVESYTDNLEELKLLFSPHWEEIAIDNEKTALDPQYEIYLSKDAAGEIVFIALRNEEKLVGYFIGFLSYGLHNRSCLNCIGDIFYVLPEHRKYSGMTLFKEVEQECRRRNVDRIYIGFRPGKKDVSPIFKRLKYSQAEQYYSKWIGKKIWQ